MIFGRKRKNSPAVDLAESVGADVDGDSQLTTQEEGATASDPVDVVTEVDGVDDAELDEWSQLDGLRNWREDGPFDIDEVDLDADDVERLDLGALVITPFEDMQLQLQVDESTNAVSSVLVMKDQSAIEISLFAAPATRSLVPEIRREMAAMAARNGGEISFAEGPFGTEIRRVMPVEGPNGEKLFHVSRTWFAGGPKWLLRGVVMGQAGIETGTNGVTELLHEFFQNIVVRRPDGPLVPGNVIAMKLPGGVGRP